MNTVWVELQNTTTTSQMTTNTLRAGTLSFGEERLVFSHKEVGPHSIRSGFAMELYLAKVYPETIIIMGQWASSAFLRYIRIQVSDLSKGISTLKTKIMLSTQYQKYKLSTTYQDTTTQNHKG